MECAHMTDKFYLPNLTDSKQITFEEYFVEDLADVYFTTVQNSFYSLIGFRFKDGSVVELDNEILITMSFDSENTELLQKIQKVIQMFHP
jgi:hypothetical protein